jgi:hypothetical protein
LRDGSRADRTEGRVIDLEDEVAKDYLARQMEHVLGPIRARELVATADQVRVLLRATDSLRGLMDDPRTAPSTHGGGRIRLLTCAAQKVNLSAACIRRGGAALTTWPNKALSMSPFTAAGPKKFV